MRRYSEILKEKFYGKGWSHPYKIFEQKVFDHIQTNATILDVGCGRTAPVLKKFVGLGRTLIGMDLCELKTTGHNASPSFIKGNATAISLKDASVDLVISRSVLEHLENPAEVYREVYRILKPEGYLIFLTPNFYDYASILSKLIPGRFHSRIVRLTEGRNEEDTFPTCYRSNTERQVKKLASMTGFEISSLDYLGQYPSYFMFNPVLFMIGTAYDKLICRFDAFKCLRGWILVVLRKSANVVEGNG